MSIFFTSDEHYFHDRIRLHSSRPFDSVEEMNYEIISRHNSIVGPEDTVYHLGDFTFKEDKISDLLLQLNGTKHLISGNHCKSHSSHKKYKKAIEKYLSYGFSTVQDTLEYQIGNRTVSLSHFPYLRENNGDDGRYSQFRLIDKGQFLIHGHVHEAFLSRGRMINVGVDRWNFYPVSEDKILELMAEIIEGEQE